MAEPDRREVLAKRLLDRALGTKYFTEFVEFTEIKGGEHVLDFGCGTGAVARHVAEAVPRGRLTCIDTSEVWLARAKRTLKGRDNVDFVLQNILVKPLEKKRYNRIICHFSLKELSPGMPERVIAELCGALTKNGFLVIREPAPNDADALKLKRMLIDAGLAQVKALIIDIPLIGRAFSGVFVRERRDPSRRPSAVVQQLNETLP